MKKAILYVNQFFGQIGGEEKAGAEPEIHEGHVGPAMQFAKELDAEITHTIICGDNYMGSNTDAAVAKILEMLEGKEIDIFLAGPAFQAGRYGVACGTICKAVQEQFHVPAVTSMNVENPGVEMFKKEMYILKGGNSAGKMRADVKAMTKVANKLLNGEEIGCADEEGYFARGIRRQVWRQDGIPASERMIDMLVKKLNGQPFQTELPIPKMDRVPIGTNGDTELFKKSRNINGHSLWYFCGQCGLLVSTVVGSGYSVTVGCYRGFGEPVSGVPDIPDESVFQD